MPIGSPLADELSAIVDAFTKAVSKTKAAEDMESEFAKIKQGTIGSRALAIKMAEANIDVTAMLAADMIAYRDPSRNIQIGVPNQVHDPALTQLVTRIINLYLPDVEVCTYTGCCTDNRGFDEQGFSTTRFFEACGALDDPKYHTPEDTLVRFGWA